MVIFRGFIRVDSVSLLSTRQRQNDLRDQSHRELVNRLFQFHKRSQLFISAHDEPLSVVAMCVCNPDRLAVGIMAVAGGRAVAAVEFMAQTKANRSVERTTYLRCSG
jgi:aminoglycoside phosphotransferase family enzyme